MPFAARFSVAILVSSATALVPRLAAAEEAVAAAATQDVDTTPVYPPPSTRWKLVLGGLATTGFFYGAAAGTSYLFPDTPYIDKLRIPVVGPWLSVAHTQCSTDDPDCSKILLAIRAVIIAIDGIGQAGGLGIALEGVFIPTQERTAPPPGSTSPKPSAPKAPPGVSPPAPSPPTEPKNLYFLPTPITVGDRGIGLGVVGRF
jgi:hypothetical protein